MTPGQVIDVERLEVAEGKTLVQERVVVMAEDNKVTVGKHLVEGEDVIATSQGSGKSKKIIVFKYKPKVRYSRKTGHRQLHTRLVIDKIVEPGAARAEPMKKPRKHTKKR